MVQQVGKSLCEAMITARFFLQDLLTSLLIENGDTIAQAPTSADPLRNNNGAASGGPSLPRWAAVDSGGGLNGPGRAGGGSGPSRSASAGGGSLWAASTRWNERGTPIRREREWFALKLNGTGATAGVCGWEQPTDNENGGVERGSNGVRRAWSCCKGVPGAGGGDGVVSSCVLPPLAGAAAAVGVGNSCAVSSVDVGVRERERVTGAVENGKARHTRCDGAVAPTHTPGLSTVVVGASTAAAVDRERNSASSPGGGLKGDTVDMSCPPDNAVSAAVTDARGCSPSSASLSRSLRASRRSGFGPAPAKLLCAGPPLQGTAKTLTKIAPKPVAAATVPRGESAVVCPDPGAKTMVRGARLPTGSAAMCGGNGETAVIDNLPRTPIMEGQNGAGVGVARAGDQSERTGGGNDRRCADKRAQCATGPYASTAVARAPSSSVSEPTRVEGGRENAEGSASTTEAAAAPPHSTLVRLAPKPPALGMLPTGMLRASNMFGVSTPWTVRASATGGYANGDPYPGGGNGDQVSQFWPQCSPSKSAGGACRLGRAYAGGGGGGGNNAIRGAVGGVGVVDEVSLRLASVSEALTLLENVAIQPALRNVLDSVQVEVDLRAEMQVKNAAANRIERVGFFCLN